MIWEVALPRLVTLNSSATFYFLHLWNGNTRRHSLGKRISTASLPDIQILLRIICIPPLQIVRTGPRGDRAEHVSLHWGHNVAAVSHFDEAAVDLGRLLASLILLALRIEQFAPPLPQETFTLM